MSGQGNGKVSPIISFSTMHCYLPISLLVIHPTFLLCLDLWIFFYNLFGKKYYTILFYTYNLHCFIRTIWHLIINIPYLIYIHTISIYYIIIFLLICSFIWLLTHRLILIYYYFSPGFEFLLLRLDLCIILLRKKFTMQSPDACTGRVNIQCEIRNEFIM